MEGKEIIYDKSYFLISQKDGIIVFWTNTNIEKVNFEEILEEMKKYVEPGIEEIFDWHADTVILPLNNETEATIVVHLSNFHDRNPGVETPFLFGLYSTLQTKIVLDKLVSSGIFSILALPSR